MSNSTLVPLVVVGGESVSPPDTGSNRKYLPEVQGLRAIAVLMVVAYHVWFDRISGGVDIFLLISAFLMTGQFTRKLESGRALELPKYWAHLFKRLLPLIAVTLLVVLSAARLLLPNITWAEIYRQTWASLFYYQNWLLAAESVDYYAADHSLASPLQHFWSLSMQGQIFILWPLIFALSALAARIWHVRIRQLLICVFGTILVTSLSFSIITTQSQQEFAYFDTRARLWEFALGSLLALTLPYLRFGQPFRILMGWVGVIAMLSCGLILQVGQQFPGYMALWPTLAAAFIIIAGFTDSPYGADRFLSWKPLVKLGDSSYALYLFHWPFLVIFLVVSDLQQADLFSGTIIIVISMVAAAAATKYIDSPLRQNKWIDRKRHRTVVVIAISVLLVAAPLTGFQLQAAAQEQRLLASADKNNPGAAALRSGFVDNSEAGAAILPTMESLNKQWVHLESTCTGRFAPADPRVEKTCQQSNVPGTVAKTIVILGDSHAQQWMGALVPVAQKHNWQLVSVLKGGCTFGAAVPDDKQSRECDSYQEAATAYALKIHPDAVVTVSTISAVDSSAESVRSTFTDAIETFTNVGTEVVGIRDNARFKLNKATCVAKNGPEACSFEQSSNFAPQDPAAGLDKDKGVYLLDFTDRFCSRGGCPAVIGNVLVYLDANHITGDYSRSMSPDFEQRLLAATKWR